MDQDGLVFLESISKWRDRSPKWYLTVYRSFYISFLQFLQPSDGDLRCKDARGEINSNNSQVWTIRNDENVETKARSHNFHVFFSISSHFFGHWKAFLDELKAPWITFSKRAVCNNQLILSLTISQIFHAWSPFRVHNDSSSVETVFWWSCFLLSCFSCRWSSLLLQKFPEPKM